MVKSSKLSKKQIIDIICNNNNDVANEKKKFHKKYISRKILNFNKIYSAKISPAGIYTYIIKYNIKKVKFNKTINDPECVTKLYPYIRNLTKKFWTISNNNNNNNNMLKLKIIKIKNPIKCLIVPKNKNTLLKFTKTKFNDFIIKKMQNDDNISDEYKLLLELTK